MNKEKKIIYVVSSMDDSDSTLLGAFYSKVDALEHMIKLASQYDYQNMRYYIVESGGVKYMTTYVEVYDYKHDRVDSKYPIDNLNYITTYKVEEVHLS